MKIIKDNPRGRQPIGGVSCGNSGKKSRIEDDTHDPDTPTSEPQEGSSTRLEGVKKAKAHMIKKWLQINHLKL